MKKNKNSIKRFLILMMSIALLISSFSGCGSNNTANKENNVQNTSSNSKDTNDSSGETNATDPVTPAEPDKLKVWASWDGMADILTEQGDAPYWKAYQKATNTEIEFLDITGGSEALSILISTGDMPDIIIEYDFNIPTGIQQSLLDKTIIPLNEPMDAGYMPNFKAYLDRNNFV